MKILLFEDNLRTGQLLKAALTGERYIVDWITDSVRAIEFAEEAYDLILLDMTLPNVNGIALCHQLRKRNCQIPILMLTVKDCDQDFINALDSGADDLVGKFDEPCRLFAKMRALMRRQNQQTTSSSRLSWGDLCFDLTLGQITYQQKILNLSLKEYCLLELFLRYPNRLFSREQIIDRIWSIDDFPTHAAVTNLVKDLRRKIKAAGMEEDLIETVYGLGYRLMSAPADNSEKSVPITPGRLQPTAARLWTSRQMAAAAIS